MKKTILHITTALLTLVAVLNVAGFIVLLALFGTIGDEHVQIWKWSGRFVIGMAIVVAGIFLVRDLAGKSSRIGFRVRLLVSLVVTLVVSAEKVRSEIRQIKGWSSEEAALNVASALYPNSVNAMTLKETSREELQTVGRGPSITYLVVSGDEPVCKVGVCRRYWFWWTCGMYETLRKRDP